MYHWLHYTTLPVIPNCLSCSFYAFWETLDELKHCVVQFISSIERGILQKTLCLYLYNLSFCSAVFQIYTPAENRILCRNRNRNENQFLSFSPMEEKVADRVSSVSLFVSPSLCLCVCMKNSVTKRCVYWKIVMNCERGLILIYSLIGVISSFLK